jgi:hypothetical protein
MKITDAEIRDLGEKYGWDYRLVRIGTPDALATLTKFSVTIMFHSISRDQCSVGAVVDGEPTVALESMSALIPVLRRGREALGWRRP